jgi:hypothetical protein
MIPAHTLSDLTVKRFMAAMFNGDYTAIPNWDELFTAYIDLSGTSNAQQYQIMVKVHNLQTRLSAIESFINFQKAFFLEFDQPFEPALGDVRRFGHTINWNPSDPEQFLAQLQRMNTKERRNVAELDSAMKELSAIQKTGTVKVTANSRQDFIKQLNALNKAGYTIDRETTDMETLALMIKDYYDEIELNSQKPKS